MLRRRFLCGHLEVAGRWTRLWEKPMRWTLALKYPRWGVRLWVSFPRRRRLAGWTPPAERTEGRSGSSSLLRQLQAFGVFLCCQVHCFSHGGANRARAGRRSVLLRLAAERGIPQHDPHLKYAGSGGLRSHCPQARGVRRRVLACAWARVVVPKSDRQRPNAVGNVDLPQGAVEYLSRKATTMTTNKSNGM